VSTLADLIEPATQLDRRAARERAQRFCSVDVMTDSYISLYRELAT